MIGILLKKDSGWVVSYCTYQDKCPSMGAFLEQHLCDIKELPIHPDDERYCEEGESVQFDVGINPFAVVFEMTPDDPRSLVAKIMKPKKDSLSQIINTQEKADRFMKDLKALNPQSWDSILREWLKQENTDTLIEYLEDNFNPPTRK